jgi:membrane protein YdbS with pleckstrin-like domain
MTILNSTITEEEKILRRIPFEIIVLSFVVALGSIFFFNPLTGGAFSALSFIWLKQSVSRLFLLKKGASPSKKKEQSSDKKGDRHLKEEEPVPFFKGQSSFLKKAIRSVLVLYAIRLVLILAIFFIIIFFFSNKIIAFVAGFSTMVPVLLVEAVVALTRMKKWKT